MIIDPNERLSRFLVNSKQFGSLNKTVKPKAFIPPKNKPLSVFRTSTLSENEIWLIGETVVAKPRGKTLYGRADFWAQDVYDLKQKVEPETSRHCLHADIIPWPDGREDMLFFATKLALKSKFIPKNKKVL